MQACSSLKENGVTTAETWRNLLGDQLPNADESAAEASLVNIMYMKLINEQASRPLQLM